MFIYTKLEQNLSLYHTIMIYPVRLGVKLFIYEHQRCGGPIMLTSGYGIVD